jgi:hypothetical protein
MDLVKSLRIYLDLDSPIYHDYKVLAKYQAEWVRVGEILAGMKGLKELRIKLDGDPTKPWKRYSMRFPLESLRNIIGLAVFQVYIPWRVRCSTIEGPAGSAPFQLIDIRQWPQQ